MSNKFFKSFFAIAMVLGAALGFVACTEQEEADPKVELSQSTANFNAAEGSQTINVKANCKWTVEFEGADWVTITPMSGSNNGTITVAVAENTTGEIRKVEAKVFAMHATYGKFGNVKLTISQSADNNATVDEELLYSDNFDGKLAEKEGNYYPWVKDFPEFANAQGPASAGVTYEGPEATVRSNANSDGSYSDYKGSGGNNIFFGSGASFVIKNIAPLKEGQMSYKLTFGTEKHSSTNGSLFTPSEFIVSLSKDGVKWAPIEYTFAGTAEGRWNVATANFTFTTLPESLYIKFEAKVASSYRLDDVKLYVGNGGQTVDLDNIAEPEPVEGVYASDSAFVCSSDDSVNAVYSLGSTTIGGTPATGFKLGKTKQAGKFTSAAVGVSGNKYLNFYAAGWNGGDVTLYYRVDGGATMSQKLVANTGASGNAPYNNLVFAKDDHYSVLLEGLTETSTIEFSTDANFELTTADSDMASARAIVCGVKLSDEPIEGVEPVIPEPVGTVTVAEAIAAADGVGVTIENATVIGVYAKGILVEDTTGKLLAYAGSAVSAAVGDVVKVEGTMATYAGLRQVGGTVVVTKTGTTTYEYPAIETMDGAALDAYLSTPSIKYVMYTGKLTISGNYYNVDVEGASTAVGSLSYPLDGAVDASLNGQTIDVCGWVIGVSSSKYVNTMVSSVVASGNTPVDPTPDPEGPETPGTEDPETPGTEQPVDGTTVTFNVAGYNFENQTALGTYEVDPITFAFDGGGNNNCPKYYTSGAAVRCYPKNTMTISGKTITKIVVKAPEDYTTNAIDLYCGSVKLENFTWTGNSSEPVVLTFDVNKTSGQSRFVSIDVTYAE